MLQWSHTTVLAHELEWEIIVALRFSRIYPLLVKAGNSQDGGNHLPWILNDCEEQSPWRSYNMKKKQMHFTFNPLTS
jgi:hypothetical protein